MLAEVGPPKGGSTVIFVLTPSLSFPPLPRGPVLVVGFVERRLGRIELMDDYSKAWVSNSRAVAALAGGLEAVAFWVSCSDTRNRSPSFGSEYTRKELSVV